MQYMGVLLKMNTPLPQPEVYECGAVHHNEANENQREAKRLLECP